MTLQMAVRPTTAGSLTNTVQVSRQGVTSPLTAFATTTVAPQSGPLTVT